MTDMSYKYSNYFALLFKTHYLIFATRQFGCKKDTIALIPQFFKILRNIGLVLQAAVAGGILSAVSQMTVSPVVPEGYRKGGVLRQAHDDTNRARDGD